MTDQRGKEAAGARVGNGDGPYPGRTEPLPNLIEGVTPEWLTAELDLRYPGAKVNGWEVLDFINSHTTKLRLKLDLNDAAREAGLAERVCLKGNWAVDLEAVGQHLQEARFYHHFGEMLGTAIPHSYFADWDGPPSNQGIVLMEDLADQGGAFGNSNDHMGIDGAAHALEGLAQLHGRSWDRPAIREAAWLPVSMDNPVDLGAPGMLWAIGEQNMAKAEYRSFLPDWVYAGCARMDGLFQKLRRYEQRQVDPYCLVHGDTHQGNSYVRANGERIWFDWQVSRKGRPWRDLAYFLIGSLTIEERRAEDRRLLAHYRDHLAKVAGDSVPGLDQIWAGYCRWPVWGCMAWVTNLDEWGQAGRHITERFYAAADDYGTVALLDAE